jgi:hypothetical protein
MKTAKNIFAPTISAILCVSVATAMSGCASHSTETTDDSVALAEDGTDANDVESQSSALTASFTLACDDFSDPATSVIASSGVSSFFTPQSCISATQDIANSTVTYTLGANGIPCTGPWGLAGIQGTVVVVYSKAQNGIQLAITGTDLAYNVRRPSHATANLTATATLTAPTTSVDGGSLVGARELTWTGSLNGMTARGNPFSRTANWVTDWRVGESCVSLNGSATGDVDGRDLKTTVSNYQRCLGTCPAAGGSITIQSNTNGEQVELDYNGGNDATFKGVTGAETKIDLACGL